jgi:membrane protein
MGTDVVSYPVQSLKDAPPPPAGVRSWWGLVKQAALDWNNDNAMRMSAAVAMYSFLSLSPLLVISIKFLAVVFGEEAATRQVELQVQYLIGPLGAKAINDMLVKASQPGEGTFATVVSAVILIFTASGVFAELRDALNEVWDVTPKAGRGWWAAIRDRLPSFGMVFVIGFLLLVSQIITTALTTASRRYLGEAGWLPQVTDFAVSTVFIALVFAALFRFLPDVRIDWRDALIGAGVTALLFKVGQYVQALYFTYGTTASFYGAAGSFVVVLLWVYYSCWILFFGAEITQVYARWAGRRIRPDANARREQHVAITPPPPPDEPNDNRRTS